MEDEKIIDLYFARSESAVAETREKYGAFLESVAWRILRSRQDTEEVVNDTYLGAWNAMPPNRPTGLRFFLAKITRNLSFTRLEYRNAGKRSALLVELDECLPDPRGSAEAAWEVRELARVLNRYLAKLDAERCALFLGRYFYNMTIPELAGKYGLTQRRVKYSLSKMRSGLREMLEKEGLPL